ncbi:MAG: DUF4157 domain-containing protein, partial [Desulfobacteraceae bacterium]
MNKEHAAVAKEAAGKRAGALSGKKDRRASGNPEAGIHLLQRGMGNQAMQRLCKSENRRNEQGAGARVTPGLVARIQASRGAGRPLPNDTQAVYEQKMGYGLDQVRIHTDENAATMADNLHAMAFTVGRDIYFGAG